ncbi:MAG: adenosine kinase [Desulfosalsimonadaceae bacterium]
MGEFAIDRNRKTIVCVGSALVDMLAKEPDAFIDRLGVEKGGMNLVDRSYIGRLIAQTTTAPALVSGGSACNTAVGVGRLGGITRFVGKLGEDELGEFFAQDLNRNHVQSVIFYGKNPTGCVLSVITPDAQRSMFTYLGASAEMRPDEIHMDCFNDAAIVHVEGYLLFNRSLMSAVLTAAKDAGARISLDLASFNVVEESKDILDELIREYVDILIANEDEARAYSGHSDEDEALEALSRHVDLAVLKTGPRGSRVALNGQRFVIAPHGNGEDPVDTTGAGDLWAAGFLFGLVNGYSMEDCGRLASVCGYEVCRVVGAKIPEQGWERISKLL